MVLQVGTVFKAFLLGKHSYCRNLLFRLEVAISVKDNQVIQFERHRHDALLVYGSFVCGTQYRQRKYKMRRDSQPSASLINGFPHSPNVPMLQITQSTVDDSLTICRCRTTKIRLLHKNYGETSQSRFSSHRG